MRQTTENLTRLIDGIPAALPQIRRFAYVLSGDMVDADRLAWDAIQRGCTRAYRLRAQRSVHGWYIRQLIKCWAQQGGDGSVRVAKRAGRANCPQSASNLAKQNPDDKSVAARRVIRWLHDRDRMIVALVLVNGDSYVQAADILRMSTIELAKAVADAQKTLAAALFPRIAIESDFISEENVFRYLDGELSPRNKSVLGQLILEDRRLTASTHIAKFVRSVARQAYEPGPLPEQFVELLNNYSVGVVSAPRLCRGLSKRTVRDDWRP